MPATAQDRQFGRLLLVLPLPVASLALLWIGSGVLALARREAAEAVLTARGVSEALAALTVVGGGLLDLALGLALLIRRWARRACIGMAAVTVVYLAGATLFAADLWLDPLAPLLKALPGLVLALATAALLEER